MEIIKLNATKREISGKKVKKLRTEGLIPAVVYGHGTESRNLSLNLRDFEKVLKQAGESTLIELSIGGDKPVNVLVQDLQYNPLRGEILHVDLHEVNMNEKLETEIPIKLVGEAPAVREQGCTLIRQMETIEVSCLPGDLVHEIEISLESLKNAGETLTVANLVVPKGIEVLNEPDQIIIIVEAPMSEDEIKAMEAVGVGDVAAVKSAADEKKAAKEAAPEAKK